MHYQCYKIYEQPPSKKKYFRVIRMFQNFFCWFKGRQIVHLDIQNKVKIKILIALFKVLLKFLFSYFASRTSFDNNNKQCKLRNLITISNFTCKTLHLLAIKFVLRRRVTRRWHLHSLFSLFPRRWKIGDDESPRKSSMRIGSDDAKANSHSAVI